jgi:hypothetical protein
MLQSLLFQSSSDNVSKGFHRTALMILFSRATDLEVTGRISTQQQSVCCGDALINFNFNWASHVEAPHNSCSEHDFCNSRLQEVIIPVYSPFVRHFVYAGHGRNAEAACRVHADMGYYHGTSPVAAVTGIRVCDHKARKLDAASGFSAVRTT